MKLEVLEETVIGTDGRDQIDLGAVDQHLELLALALTIDALGGLERDVVGAGNEVDGLAQDTVALDVGHLAAVGGVGIAGRDAAVVLGHARGRRKQPGRNGRSRGAG